MLLKSRHLGHSTPAPLRVLHGAFFLLLCLAPALATAGEKPKPDKAVAPGGGKLKTLEDLGLPNYVPPPSFHEDLVIRTKDGPMTMKRSVDHGQIRTEMSSQGQSFVMIEAGDAAGTTYMLMPDEKRAMKQSRAVAEEAVGKMGQKVPKAKDASAPPTNLEVEDLGEETLDGTAARKVRMISEGAEVFGWFDTATGAPLKMESTANGEKSEIEWKNRRTEPQPAELFTVPKGYELTDMDEMMKQMGAMKGMGGPGMGGMGVGGMAKGMAGGMVQGMGSNLGSSLGSTIGGSLGGPLGAVAGRFVGGKIGGMLGKKAANAIH